MACKRKPPNLNLTVETSNEEETQELRPGEGVRPFALTWSWPALLYFLTDSSIRRNTYSALGTNTGRLVLKHHNRGSYREAQLKGKKVSGFFVHSLAPLLLGKAT